MALATRLACALAAVALAHGTACGAASDMSDAYTTGGLGGYSLSYDRDHWSDAFSVFHMAVVDPVGVLSSGFAASDDPRLRPLTRLDSSWNLTAPFLQLPLRLGDTVTSAGLWDEPTRVGGVQIGNLQPALPEVVAPPNVIALPYEAGPLTLASTRFIDHMRSVVQLEQQSLVAPGEAVYSLEAGRLRENFELRSGDYGSWITSGSYRYGLDSATTLAGDVAQLEGQQSFVGLGMLEGLGPAGLLSAKVEGSRDPDASGWLARMGYDFSRDGLSIAVRSHIQSAGFQDVGDAASLEPFRQRTLASARFDLGALGRISLASATQTYVDDTRRDVLALSHVMPFGHGGIFSTAAAYSPGAAGGSALLFSFTYPFDIVARPVRRTSGIDSALDRSIVDAFAQTGPPLIGHPETWLRE